MNTAAETVVATEAPQAEVASQKVIVINGLSEAQRLMLHAMLLGSPDGISVQSNHLHEPAPQSLTLTLDNIEATISGLSAKQREIVLRRLQQITTVQ